MLLISSLRNRAKYVKSAAVGKLNNSYYTFPTLHNCNIAKVRFQNYLAVLMPGNSVCFHHTNLMRCCQLQRKLSKVGFVYTTFKRCYPLGGYVPPYL
jgi:hypothetical protein